MPITIGSNISSLKAQRRLAENSSHITSTFERLSSGQRINRASDDAAGLAIADSLRSNRAVFTQGVRNLNDGISLLSIADSAVQNLSSIVIRLKELAEQAANGSYGSKQRAALDSEAQTLADEYLRIAQSTTFNGRQLFSADFGELRLQGGFGIDGSILSSLGGAAGLGTLGSRTLLDLGNGSQNTEEVRLADLNGDGFLDMVTGVDDGSDGHIGISFGDGSGTFGTETTYFKSDSSFNDLELVDLNNDGHLDIVTNSANSLNIRMNNGDGTFGAATLFSHPYNVSGIAFGDMNGDGIADVVTAPLTNGIVSIRMGQGDGTFGSVTTLTMEGTASRDVQLADLNNDGVLDLLTAGTTSGVGAVTIRLGAGDGTFGASYSYAMDTNRLTVEAGDFDGDGNLDIIAGAVGSTNSIVRLGYGDGTFGDVVTIGFGVLELGDFNGDGHLDVLGGNGGGALHIALGIGDGTFGGILSYVMDDGTVYSVALGDLNGDGVYDVVTGGYSSSISDASAAIRLQDTSPGIGALNAFSLRTIADANQALGLFSNSLNRLSAQRGVIGAFQARLEVATNVLTASSENFASAEGRIRDTDIAEDAAKLATQQILQRAATAVLAQANQQPAIAVNLLSINN
ncbi:MAG: VCBS repeat-containing protein [Deltaproteobacteria bacterium]|nr:VCBS repeat-containing protein [Deltaproteobacteria bacterium]